MTYREQYQTVQWKVRRAMILDRDGHACVKCNECHNVQVHHIYYCSDGRMAWEYEDDNFETLCVYHHEREHNTRYTGSFFRSNMRKWKFGIVQLEKLCEKYGFVAPPRKPRKKRLTFEEKEQQEDGWRLKRTMKYAHRLKEAGIIRDPR